MTDKQVKKALSGLVHLCQRGEAHEALEAARSVPDELLKLFDFRWIQACIFADRGEDALDKDAVLDAIAIFKSMVEDEALDRSTRVSAMYNLANAEASHARIHQESGALAARLRAWKRQRSWLQAALLAGDDLEETLRPQALVNYGNALSQLGRHSEGIDSYLKALRLVPGHPMAAGQAGRALLRLSPVQPKHLFRIHAEAQRLLRQSLADESWLARLGGPTAADEFVNALQELEEWIERHCEGGLCGFQSRVDELARSHEGWTPNHFLAQWMNDGLLLTTNPTPQLCPKTAIDDLYIDGFSTQAGGAGIKQFDDLIHGFNQLKEDFATARYLYYVSQTSDPEIVEASAATHYAEAFDGAEFGLRPGLLKTSFRVAADVLDKAASFLNLYLELGVDAREANAANLWYKDGDYRKGLRPEVKALVEGDASFQGVYDIYDTWREFPGPLKTIRNDATHKFLPLYGPVGSLELGADLGAVTTHDFALLTLDLLHIVKGLLVGIVGFVQRREAMARKQPRQNMHIPMEFRSSPSRSDLEDSL